MPDLHDLLSDRQLEALRAGFSDELMGRAGIGALADGHPPVAPWAQAVGDRFFLGVPPERAMRRETAILAVLAAQGRGQELAIHVYWALMVGHSVEELLDTLFLTGAYAGFPAWHSAQKLARRVLGLLAEKAEAGDCDCRRVVMAIAQAVPS